MSIRPVDAIRMGNGRKRAFVRGHPMSDDLSLDLEDLEFACIWLAPVGARCRFRPSEGRFLVQAPYKGGLLGEQNGVQSPFWHRSHRGRGACECIKIEPCPSFCAPKAATNVFLASRNLYLGHCFRASSLHEICADSCRDLAPRVVLSHQKGHLFHHL